MSLKTKTQSRSLLREFFFAEEVPFGLALTRIAVPLAVSIPMWYRLPRVRQLFTSDGAPTQLSELFGNGPTLPVLSPGIAIPLYGVMLLCLMLASVGFRTRLSLCIATPLYLYFNPLDAVGTMTKYSVIGAHMLLLLAVSRCGAVWSVDAFLKQRNSTLPSVIPPRVPVWPVRLIQLLFCFVYFGAALTKIQTEAFFSGEQMRYWMLSNWNYENPVGELMAMWSPLLPISAYVAVIWEILFGFLVFQRRSRIWMLGMGIAFHVMTWLTLGLFVFPAICLSGYLAFVTQDDVLWWRRRIRRRRVAALFSWPARSVSGLMTRIPAFVPAGVAWTCMIAAAAIAATELDLQLDLYARNRPEGFLELSPLDADVARTMIRDKQPLREQDKFFSFDLGTVSIGNQLANRRSEFTYGQTMIAQCNLNPPHEDLWVECLLQDSEQRTVEQFGQFVTRDMLRANFIYHIGNKLLPGEYSMLLKSANQEIYRRPFRLTGTPPQQTLDAGLLTN
ncbi:MAG: HTTM domain-containing protein [Fuerstiella sp.]